MIRSRVNALAVVAAVAIFGACSEKKSSGGGGGGAAAPEQEENGDEKSTPPGETAWNPVEGQGCVQGVILDGFTGQRIDLSKIADPSGAFVLIRGKKLKARFISDDPNLIGEYHICGIPVEQDYPLFTYLPGYLPFETTVNITSTRAVRTSGADNAVASEAKIPDPIKLTNIKVFPLAASARDLRIRVVYQGGGVANVNVKIEPKTSVGGHYAFEGDFANTAGTRVLPLSATTSADGFATFKGADLALGHRYTLWSFTAADSGLAAPAARDFTYGIGSSVSTNDFDGYELTVTLTDANKALKAVSCSLQDKNFAGDGSVTITFNRPLAVIDPDSWRASLVGKAGGSTADLKADVANNNIAEMMTAVTSDRTLILKPVWGTATAPKPVDLTKDPNDPQNIDKDLRITYDGSTIKLNVVGLNSVNNIALNDASLGVAAVCGAASPSVRIYQEME